MVEHYLRRDWPQRIARLWEVGTWNDLDAWGSWALVLNPAGTALSLVALNGSESAPVLTTPVEWCAGDWHQVAVAWLAGETLLAVDGAVAGTAVGIELQPIASYAGTFGFAIGSDVHGGNLAQGDLEEFCSFPRALTAEEILRDYNMNAPVAALGPITEQELQSLAATLAAPTAQSLALESSRPPGRDSQLPSLGDCASELQISRSGGNVIVTIVNATPGKTYDLFRIIDLRADSGHQLFWQWLAAGINGQSFTFPMAPYRHAFYVLGCDQDSDTDGLTDAFENLVEKTSPDSSDTDDDGFSDLQERNVLVNDLAHDYGKEQNTQDETTLLAFDNTVITVWVDSNLGVPGYGFEEWGCGSQICPPPVGPIQFIGWAVSRDGGQTFTDKGALPLLQPGNKGNAGDPVLARDNTFGTIYLVGNPQRPSSYYPNGPGNPAEIYVPLWHSTDNAETFSAPINATPGLVPVSVVRDFADKPALVVDNFPGAGSGNVYLAVTIQRQGATALVLYRSGPGGTSWQKSEPELPYGFPSLAVGPNHHVYLVYGSGTSFYSSKSTDGGANFSVPTASFLTANSPVGDLQLRRSNSSPGLDHFRTPILPTLVANPVLAGHLYMIYNDRPASGADQSNVYFVQSTDGGVTWGPPIKVNVDATTTDQWQPAMTVKPDGSKLFVAWYDRRKDVLDNSLMATYGALVTLPVTSGSSFADNFPISSVIFPPVFTGTNAVPGSYDPAYPPERPEADPLCCNTFTGTYAVHMGDYDTAVSDDSFIYYTWSDRRLRTSTTLGLRNQSDVRLIRIPWAP